MRHIKDLFQSWLRLPKAKQASDSFALVMAAFVGLCLSVTSSAAQEFRIDGISLTTNNARQVAISTDANSYFCLLRGDNPASITNIISLVLGDGSSKHLYDVSSLAAAGFYRVSQISRASSLDLDGDGMPDVFELTYGLNPLNPADAGADPDQDGYTNLQEYYLGTDPTVPSSFPSGGGLVINEIDYDNVGTDMSEFVEILNTSTTPMSLQNLALVFLNGAMGPATEYFRLNLGSAAPILYPGQYLVACPASLAVLGTALRIDLSATGNVIQNGAPDGVALVNTLTFQVIDALSYEGSITTAQVLGFPTPVSLVEGAPLSAALADSNTVQGSLARWPNGTDSNNAATDWIFTTIPTPGSANISN